LRDPGGHLGDGGDIPFFVSNGLFPVWNGQYSVWNGRYLVWNGLYSVYYFDYS
jgi:hypothetical protein